MLTIYQKHSHHQPQAPTNLIFMISSVSKILYLILPILTGPTSSFLILALSPVASFYTPFYPIIYT